MCPPLFSFKCRPTVYKISKNLVAFSLTRAALINNDINPLLISFERALSNRFETNVCS